MHRHQPATAAPVTSPTPGAISAAPAGSSGRGSWVSIPAIIHPIPPGPVTALIFSGTGPPRPPRHAGKRGETGNKSRPGPRSGSNHTPSASRHVRSPGTSGSASGTWRNGFRPGRYDHGKDLQALPSCPKASGGPARTSGWSATAPLVAGPAAGMSSLSAPTCARPRTSRSRSSTTSAPMSLSTRRPGGCCSATRQELGWTSTSARTPASRPTGRCCATSTRCSAASRSGPSAARTSRRSIAAMHRKGLSASRIGCAHLVVSAVLAEAVRDKKLAESPCTGIQLPGVVTAADFILPAHAQVEAVAAGLPPDWATTVWLMHGCGLRIGEALAVSLRCRISKGKTLPIREQVDPNAQLRPLKFRKAGHPAAGVRQRGGRQARHRAWHHARRVPVPGTQVQARRPPLLPGGLPALTRRTSSAPPPRRAFPPEFIPHDLCHFYASTQFGRGYPDHRGVPVAWPQEHRGHPPDYATSCPTRSTAPAPPSTTLTRPAAGNRRGACVAVSLRRRARPGFPASHAPARVRPDSAAHAGKFPDGQHARTPGGQDAMAARSRSSESLYSARLFLVNMPA